MPNVAYGHGIMHQSDQAGRLWTSFPPHVLSELLPPSPPPASFGHLLSPAALGCGGSVVGVMLPIPSILLDQGHSASAHPVFAAHISRRFIPPCAFLSRCLPAALPGSGICARNQNIMVSILKKKKVLHRRHVTWGTDVCCIASGFLLTI